METWRVLCLLLLASLASSQTTECRPGENCQTPDCRCWNDTSTPGGIAQKDTPQMILFTFQGAINNANIDLYTGLFGDAMNPNNCSGMGTFFVQQTNTNLSLLKSLWYDHGHEFGVTSINGTLPETEEEWRNNIAQVRKAVSAAGVSFELIMGVRAPQLHPGGLEEFNAMAQENFLYDASCSTATFDDESSPLWPYTYDFTPGAACDHGETPGKPFPGRWQLMVADLEFNGTKCATPSACTQVSSQKDVFDLFYDSFRKHYEGRRTPFMVVIDPEWVSADYKRAGTRQFVEYVSKTFKDTWLLTVTQALIWMAIPVTNADAITNYFVWDCPSPEALSP